MPLSKAMAFWSKPDDRRLSMDVVREVERVLIVWNLWTGLEGISTC